jgi:hypothetical protein
MSDLTLPQIVQHWEKRWRWRMLWQWLPRAVLACLVVVAVLMIAVYVFGAWQNTLGIVVVGLGASLMGLAGLARWRLVRSLPTAARYYDVQWNLQERLSTALEILNGRNAQSPLAPYQLADALKVAQAVNLQKQLPLVTSRREWIAVLIGLGVVVGLVWLNINTFNAQDPLSAEARVAIENAEQTLETIAQEIAQDTTITPETREALLSTIESRLDTLSQPDVTVEEAFAATNDVQTELQAVADQLGQQAQLQQQGFEQAREALNSATGENAGTMEEAFANLSDQVSQSTDQQRNQDLADATELAADMMMSQNPELADLMRDVAEDLRNGNNEGAQQSLNQAQDQAQQSSAQANELQESADNLNQNAQQLSENSAELSQSEQNNATSSEQESQPNAQNQSQSTNAEEGQVNQQQQSGDQNAPSPQSGENSQSQSMTQSNSSSSSSQSASSDAAQNGQTSPEGGEGESTSGSTNDIESDNNSQGGDQSTENPDGEGESQFAPVYAPENIDPLVNTQNTDPLQTDASQAPIQPADSFSQLNDQTNSVPYNQVFNRYVNQASSALESDYVPLGLKDVIREYFNGIQP